MKQHKKGKMRFLSNSPLQCQVRAKLREGPELPGHQSAALNITQDMVVPPEIEDLWIKLNHWDHFSS